MTGKNSFVDIMTSSKKLGAGYKLQAINEILEMNPTRGRSILEELSEYELKEVWMRELKEEQTST